MPYTAGTIILQVVPSYLGFQDENKKMAKALADSLDESLERGAESGAKKASAKISKILGEETGKGAEEAGDKSAEKYAGAFRTRLEKSLASMQREIKPIELNTASTKTLAELDKIKAALKSLSETEIKPGMDVRGLLAEAAKVEAALESMGKDVDIDVQFDTKKGLATWRSFVREVEALKPKIDVVPDFQLDKIERKLGTLEKMIKDRLSRAASSLGDSVDREVSQIRARLATLGTKQIGIDIDAGVAMAELQKIERELAHIAATTTNVQVHADATEALVELKAVDSYARKLNGLEPNIKPKVDTKDATTKLSLFDRLLKKVGLDGRDVANSFRFFSFAVLAVAAAGAALIPILSVAGAGIAGLGVAALAGAAGLGVLFLAFRGVGDAIKALNDQQDNAAKEEQQRAKTVGNAARQVADAQRSLVRARENAAESQGDAERQLSRTIADTAKANQDAARRTADARRQAAEDIESAIKRQQDAEKNATNATKDATQAQLDLNQARVEAKQDLEDLAAQQRRNNLDERQAVIDLFNATVQNNATQADPGSTNLEKDQADINLKSAQLRLEDIRKEQKKLADEQKKGVNGSDKVKTAQDKLTTALENQLQAQKDLKQADKDLTQQRLDSAQSVQDAITAQNRTYADGQESISDARRTLDRAVADGQQSIADAQRNLVQAQEDYTTALTESRASAQQVAEAMGKLSPAGQAFALFIHSMRDDFRDIQAIAQEGFLPGLTDALKLLLTTYGPELKTFVGTMAKLFGDGAKFAAQVFTNKDWQTFFGTIAAIAPIITKDFGKAFLDWLEVFANLAVGLAPLALDISGSIVKWSDAVLAWSKSPEGHKAITDFLAYVKSVAPDVKDFLKALALAFIAIVKAVAPFADDILRALTSFLNFIANMDPKVLGGIIAAVLGLVVAFQALSGIISIIAIVAGSTIGLVVVAVVALIAALVYFYNTNDKVKQIIDAIWPAIRWLIEEQIKYTKFAVNALAVAILAVASALKWAWEKIFSPIVHALGSLFADVFGDIAWLWNHVLAPILKALGTVIQDLWIIFVQPALSAIGTAFKGLFDGIKWIWDHTLGPVFSAIADKLGIDTSGKANGGGLVGAFTSAVGLIKGIWDGLVDISKKPIDFLVGTVINKGLIAGFNSLAGHFPGVKNVDPIPWPPPGFANGTSRVPDSSYGTRFGYMPGRDNQLIAVGGGEAVLRPEASRVLGGPWVDEINKRAKLYGTSGVARFLGGFKNGGEVQGGSGVGIFDRTTWRGKSLDYYTIKILQAAEALSGQMVQITQGSYSTAVAASGSTHAGGGVFDLHWPGGIMGNQLVAALRAAGAAAWHRLPSQGPWPHHIHGVAIGDPTESASAQAQVRDYLNGGNGLGGKDDGPNVKKDKGLLGKLLGGATGLLDWVTDAISNPVDWLKGKITGQLDKLTSEWGDNSFTQMLKAIPESIIQGMANMIQGIIPGLGGDSGGGDVKDMVKGLAQSMFGWTGGQWNAIDKIVSQESSWNPDAQNPSSSAYGLFQFLDGTWSPYGKKTNDPKLQATYGLQYIKDRYGSPEGALDFRNQHGWYSDGGTVPDNGTMMYDNGGYLPPGVTQVVNLTGKPEPVFTSKQFEGMKGNAAGAGIDIDINMNGSNTSATDVADEVLFAARRIRRGGAYAGSNG